MNCLSTFVRLSECGTVYLLKKSQKGETCRDYHPIEVYTNFKCGFSDRELSMNSVFIDFILKKVLQIIMNKSYEFYIAINSAQCDAFRSFLKKKYLLCNSARDFRSAEFLDFNGIKLFNRLRSCLSVRSLRLKYIILLSPMCHTQPAM